MHLEASHLCTQMRGVEEHSRTVTTFWRGDFDDPELRREFLHEVRSHRPLADERRRARLRRRRGARRRARRGARARAATASSPSTGTAEVAEPTGVRARGGRPDLGRRGRGALGSARGDGWRRAGSSTPSAASAPGRSRTPSPTTLRFLHDLNLGTAWWSCRAAARRLPEGGAIVNVASRTGVDRRRRARPPTRSPKAGVVRLTRGARRRARASGACA